MKRKNKILIWVLVFSIALFGFFYFSKISKKESSLGLEIFSYQNSSKVSTNVYDFMNQLKNEGKINFKEKTYPGMGKFIYEINGIKNKDKNWIYYVNNKKATIGISNYKIGPGDVVSWKYEDSY